MDAFEERCVDATVRLTHAMSPTVVLLVRCENLEKAGEAIRETNGCLEAVPSSKIFQSQDGRRRECRKAFIEHE